MRIIRREYVEIVRRKSFIISTVLVPVLMLVFVVVPVLLSVLEPAKAYQIAIVDQTGVIGAELAAALTDTLQDGSAKYASTVVDAPGDRFDAARTARIAEVQSGTLNIVIAVPVSVLDDGKAAYITRDERNFNVLERIEDALNDIVIKQRLAAEGLDYGRVKSLTTSVSLEMNQVTAEGGVEKKDFLGEWGLVFAFTLILYMALLSWGVTISKSIIEEKSSRIMEVVLSSVSPRQFMTGKLVGVGLAGLTQLTIWASIGAAISTYAATGMVAMLSSFHIEPVVFVYFLGFFVLGFLLFSALFMTVGAMCSNDQDAQQLQGLITLPLVVPLLTLMLLIQNPNSGIAVVLSLVPLFSPMVMLARIILIEPPAWQVALSMVLLAASIYFAIGFAARVFRVGALMYGKPPSLRELARWYREAG
jgi:ABC-2 type transport system permease protein